MSENVFILGAGASFEAGAPLMNNFLDIAEDLLVSGKVNEHREAYEAVFQAISELQIVYSKSYLDLNNIESLFGAIEMGNIVDRLVKKTGEEIGLVRESLIKLIVHTLEKSMTFPVYDKRIHAPGAYSEFVELVHDLGDSSFITFNYDLGLDYALLSNNQTTIDYCLTPERKGNMKLLKLHGSINWGKCEECGEIIEYSLDNYFRRHRPQIWNDTEYYTLPVSNDLLDLEHCNV